MTNLRSLTPEDKAFVDALIRVGLCLLVVGQAAAGYTESDIWGHMSIGLDMLRDRHFLWVDPYSFTHDQAWINHEWLWDLAVAAIYRAGGLPAIVAMRALLVGVVLWVLDRSTRRAPGWARLTALVLVGLACTGQWRSTRPQLATLAAYAIVLTVICGRPTTDDPRLTTNDPRLTTHDQRLTTNDQRPLPSWLPLLFVVWANLHGGWVFGLGAVAAYVLTHPSRRSTLVAIGCAVATLVNPYGFHLWTAIADAMQRGWADVGEWQPIWRVGAGIEGLVLWLTIAGAAALLWRRVAREPWPWLWSFVAVAAAANSRRLTALAALTCALLLVPGWKSSAEAVRIVWTPVRRWVAAGVVAGSLVGATLFIQPTLSCFPPVPEWRAPEPDAVAFLRTTDVKRIVPHFDFGEYAIFYLRDRMQVAIDNRRETVYSDAAVQANQRFTDGLDPEYPERIGADAVWWPADQARVIEPLERRGWVRRFEGPRTVILMKSVGPVTRGRATVGTPCFPEP